MMKMFFDIKMSSILLLVCNTTVSCCCLRRQREIQSDSIRNEDIYVQLEFLYKWPTRCH
jgi:hypothetical protein